MTKIERRVRIARELSELLAELHVAPNGERLAERLCYETIMDLMRLLAKDEQRRNPFDRLVDIMELKAVQAKSPAWATIHSARNAILDRIGDAICL